MSSVSQQSQGLIGMTGKDHFVKFCFSTILIVNFYFITYSDHLLYF